MATLATRTVTLPFKSPRKDAKVWVLTDVNDWQPQEMKAIDSGYEHTFEVPKERQELLYKFRIGDWDYANDTEAPSVPDGFGGINNRYEIPALPEPKPEPVVEIVPLLEEEPKPAAPILEEKLKPAAPLKSRQTDLEDEAYHSSDSATPKASRAASISSQQGVESMTSVPEILPMTENAAVDIEQTVGKVAHSVETKLAEPVKEQVIEPAKETVADLSAAVSKEASKAKPQQPQSSITKTKKNQDLPLYLGLAAITVAVVAYFLRLVESFIPIDERRNARGPVTKAMKSVIVMLVTIATVAQRKIEERRR